MIVIAAEVVGCNVHILYPHLSVKYEAEGINERGLSSPDALDLRASEHNARSPAVEHLVVMLGTFVFDVDTCRFDILLFCHISSELLDDVNKVKEVVVQIVRYKSRNLFFVRNELIVKIIKLWVLFVECHKFLVAHLLLQHLVILLI